MVTFAKLLKLDDHYYPAELPPYLLSCLNWGFKTGFINNQDLGILDEDNSSRDLNLMRPLEDFDKANVSSKFLIYWNFINGRESFGHYNSFWALFNNLCLPKLTFDEFLNKYRINNKFLLLNILDAIYDGYPEQHVNLYPFNISVAYLEMMSELSEHVKRIYMLNPNESWDSWQTDKDSNVAKSIGQFLRGAYFKLGKPKLSRTIVSLVAPNNLVVGRLNGKLSRQSRYITEEGIWLIFLHYGNPFLYALATQELLNFSKFVEELETTYENYSKEKTVAKKDVTLARAMYASEDSLAYVITQNYVPYQNPRRRRKSKDLVEKTNYPTEKDEMIEEINNDDDYEQEDYGEDNDNEELALASSSELYF